LINFANDILRHSGGIWGFIYLLPKFNRITKDDSVFDGDTIKAGLLIGGMIGLALGFATKTAISFFLNIILARKMNRGHYLLLKYYDLCKQD